MEEKMEMNDLEEQNRHLLLNVLPTHVAAHFIDVRTISNKVMVDFSTHNCFILKYERLLGMPV